MNDENSGTPRALPRPEWRDLEPARGEDAGDALNLADNTNRFGSPPAALAALRAEPVNGAADYPSAYGESLKGALARYTGAAPECLVTGCGSDDVLDSAIRAFGRPGERFAHLEPTFPMAPYFARLNGLVVKAAPMSATGEFDPEALLAGDPAVVYLCSPNNPTGALLGRELIERVIEQARGVVLLDEAYAEFAGGDWIRCAPAHANLVVVRTLSKAFGLAGLRVGYAAGQAALVRRIEISRGPYKIGAAAERAAVAALTHDLEWVNQRTADAVAARERLADALIRLGVPPLRSYANFLLVPVPDAFAVAGALRGRGIAVRAFAALPGIGDAIRIGAAPWPQLERACDALAQVLACA